MADTAIQPSPGQLAQWACCCEVLAPKAGNVHPSASFDDADASDFLSSALAMRPVLDRVGEMGVGATVRDAVIATQAVVGHNTNLGMLLLLTPMAAVPVGDDLAQGVKSVLTDLTADDATAVYEAIRLAQPGGLGDAAEADVRDAPPANLIQAMALAADRDLIARQYATDFADVLDRLTPWLVTAHLEQGLPLDLAIVRVHLQWLATELDTLIQRKCGQAMAEEARDRARRVLDTAEQDREAGNEAFVDFDQWLRADGHRRNPGASADLVAAGLFAAMHQGQLRPPWPWLSTLTDLADDWLIMGS